MARDPDELSLEINGEEFRFWQDPTVTRSIDTYSTVGFSAPFEPDREEFRNLFRPFRYQTMRVLLAGEPLVTGTLMHIVPKVDEKSKTVDVTGWAKPAALNCNMPASAFPLEFTGVGLREIATSLAAPFEVDVTFEADEGAAFGQVSLKQKQKKRRKRTADPGPGFEKVALLPGGQVQEFLVGLAQQRGLVMTDTPEGELRFWQSTSGGHPVAKLEGGQPPLCRVTPQFSPATYYSEITAFVSAQPGRAGSSYTERNPWLDGIILRPHNFELQDTDPADAPAAARAKLGRMFAEMASFTIENLPTWRDPQGDLWEPNTTIMLTCPDAMIYKPTEFLIRDVTLVREAETKTAALGVVMLGAFEGAAPETLPWT